MKMQTTAEHIAELNKLVSYTLWKMATEDPNEHRDDSVQLRPNSASLVQSHAEFLFRHKSWISETVGEFCALSGEVPEEIRRL